MPSDRSPSPSANHHRAKKDRSRSPSKHKSHRHREENDDRRKHRHDDDRKHRRDKEETEEERKERKRTKRDKKRSERGNGQDEDDEGSWVEKGAGVEDAVSNIPSALSLPLTSNPSQSTSASLHQPTASETERPAWMMAPSAEESVGAALPAQSSEVPHSATSGPGDFFSDLGTEHKRKDPNEGKPDPTKLQFGKRELNRQLVEGKTLDEYKNEEKKVVPGGPGYQWRMMKLRRIYEQAEEQGKDVEQVALERYGSLEEFQEAIDERRVLDEREQRRNSRRGNTGSDGYSSQNSTGFRTPETTRRFVFNDSGDGSRPPSRTSFRRPGEEREGLNTPGNRVEELKRSGAPAKSSTPIPSVFTPQSLGKVQPQTTPSTTSSAKPPLSLEALNRLQAKVLRAKLMDDPNAEALEDEYETERHRAVEEKGLWEGDGSGSGLTGQMGRENVDERGRRREVQVLPTLDGRGRLYDVGTGGKDDAEVLPGNKRKKNVDKFETRDNKGEVLRYNEDDDDLTLGELVRQERFGAGSADQKNLDAEMAAGIARDGKFEDDTDYMDDNAEKLARRKMKSDALKRAFAVNDYARTKKALDTCTFCYQDERPPQTAIVALGKRTYLCCTQYEELVDGHCLIVPLQHCLSTLELEDDDWDEIRNFMKCLMKMYALENKGVLFYETCISFKHQKHTYIECVPVPAAQFQDAPAYFRESILASESEWSQHKKVIDFSARPGGFRRALVPNIPYFMIQWDYKGEKGYGHVIEGVEDSAGRGEGEDGMGGPMEEEGKGGAFPRNFAAEVIGNVLGLEPRLWRKPRRLETGMNKERARRLGEKFQPYNWTVQLQE
ncbi:CWF19-like protein 2, partial [Tremellales sp. Uapishka_1]